jgi:hypothetical protein
MSPRSPTKINTHQNWDQRIPGAEWAVYLEVIRQARALGIRFAFGGAFAIAVYTGELRNTKDFDFYLLPADRDAMKEAMTRAGLRDYFDRLAYDRSWIYRASREDIIVDAIWTMANHRAEVDEHWLSRGPEVTIRGEPLRAIPIEDLIWSKLYVLQRERCDWGDVVNLIDAQTDSIDWEYLLNQLGEDAPLLTGALSVFAWLVPHRASDIPSEVWSRLGLCPSTQGEDPKVSRARANLLDSRPWFTRHLR